MMFDAYGNHVHKGSEILLNVDGFLFLDQMGSKRKSCLALRYEALVLRDLKSATYQWLQVSYREWPTFAEHSLDNGFYSIARKGELGVGVSKELRIMHWWFCWGGEGGRHMDKII
ncbi:hypothetical protein L1049_024574 [Liquidambar formosana]|uniref:Uncharacterized protein n=1 Tax=Liquidambar formosana TaxID=63359 RepID=A0AAP0X4P9_LIQFO